MASITTRWQTVLYYKTGRSLKSQFFPTRDKAAKDMKRCIEIGSVQRVELHELQTKDVIVDAIEKEKE